MKAQVIAWSKSIVLLMHKHTGHATFVKFTKMKFGVSLCHTLNGSCLLWRSTRISKARSTPSHGGSSFYRSHNSGRGQCLMKIQKENGASEMNKDSTRLARHWSSLLLFLYLWQILY